MTALDAAEPVHGRQGERSGFAGTGFCGSDDVAAFEYKQNGLRLHGGGFGIAEPLDGGECLLGQTEFVEWCSHDLRKSISSVRHGFCRASVVQGVRLRYRRCAPRGRTDLLSRIEADEGKGFLKVIKGAEIGEQLRRMPTSAERALSFASRLQDEERLRCTAGGAAHGGRARYLMCAGFLPQ